jgi:hypothetical protein
MEMMATLKREMNGDVLMVSTFQGSGLLVTNNLGLRFAACPEPAEWAAQAITLRAFSPPDPVHQSHLGNSIFEEGESATWICNEPG